MFSGGYAKAVGILISDAINGIVVSGSSDVGSRNFSIFPNFATGLSEPAIPAARRNCWITG